MGVCGGDLMELLFWEADENGVYVTVGGIRCLFAVMLLMLLA